MGLKPLWPRLCQLLPSTASRRGHDSDATFGAPAPGQWPVRGLRQFVCLEQKLESDLRGLSDENYLGNWYASMEILGLAELAFLREENSCSVILQLLQL